MSNGNAKHIFISYVREDSAEVDRLCAVLDAAQIPYWRDRNALGPGDAWKAKIREAIRSGSVVFLACFSDRSRAKDKSYMNEELTLAVDEFRQMPPGRTWLIPVRFDAGDVPYWDLGAGRALSDLNFSDLFGAQYAANATRLVMTALRITGEEHVSAATALAAVEAATATDRTDLLSRLTKEMLLDPTRRIELDDLVAQEVQRVNATLIDATRFVGPIGDTADKQVERLAHEANDYWNVAAPFCASLLVAARWGAPDALAPWANGIRTFVTATGRIHGGVIALLDMRHLPGIFAIMTTALGCGFSGNWGNLKALIADQTVRDPYDNNPLSILEATDLYKSFGNIGPFFASALALSATQDRGVVDSLKDFTENRSGRRHTPDADWLHHVLRPLFASQWPDDEAYDAAYDRAEVVVGVLAEDALNARRTANANGQASRRTHWFGRSTWRSAHDHGDPVADLIHELETQGASWAPLQAGLFGGNPERARTALEGYGDDFAQVGKRQQYR